MEGILIPGEINRRWREIDIENEPNPWRRNFDMLIRKYVSVHLTKLLLRTSVTANQITLSNILLGMFIGLLFVNGHKTFMLLGALLLQLWCVLDYVDGEIARCKGTDSITGLFFDRLNPIIVMPFIFMCLSFGIYNTLHNALVLFFGFSTALSITLIKLVVFIMYTSACDVRLRSRYGDIKPKGIMSDTKGSGITELQDSLISSSSIFYNIVDFMLWPGILWAILFASVIDIFAPTLVFDSFTFNSMFMLLFLLGVLTPLGWIGLTILIIKKKSPEKLYISLFGDRDL